jgi:aminoglycoside phosphotransferase (APT) family kinase protein
MAQAQPGPLIARGRAADVFDLGDGRVLRRYRTAHSCRIEAEIMAQALAAGFPAPLVHEVAGGDLVMDRIAGPTMLQRLERAPWQVVRAADRLATLHRRLHEIPFENSCLVHLDLHPENVILSTTGPVVIDWSNARAGTAEEDVAQTWLIVGARADPCRTCSWCSRSSAAFSYAGLRHFDRDAVVAVLPSMAEARMRDRNVTPADREQIVRLVERALAGAEC